MSGRIDMAIVMEKDGYKFDFSDSVIDIISFDENKKLLCDGMKSVDIIAEFPNEYLFLELKKYKNGSSAIID